jgi:bifunctional non-homologous end joining protein LigD
MPLEEYKHKRDFKRTSEPRPGRLKARNKDLSDLIQKHDATRLLTIFGWTDVAELGAAK